MKQALSEDLKPSGDITTQFIKPCNLCPHMKKITLNKVYDCLKNETNEIKIGDNIAKMARKSVQRMASVGR